MKQQVNYKASLLIGQTAMPMRARLAQTELHRLSTLGKVRPEPTKSDSSKRAQFYLMDGPSYANGLFHPGTGLNKIIKDIEGRTKEIFDNKQAV